MAGHPHWMTEMRVVVNLVNKYINVTLDRDTLALHELTEYVRKFQHDSDQRMENIKALRKLAGCFERILDDEQDRLDDEAEKEAKEIVLSCLN